MNRKTLKNATTGLAGAVALASGSQAYGAVVSATLPANFTPTSGTTTTPAVIPWDVNGDGTVDFDFQFYQASTAGNWVSGIYGLGGVGTAAPVAYKGSYVTYVNKLSLGTTIGSSSAFYQETGYVAVLASRFSGTFYGQFTNAGTPQAGWVGFEFTALDGIHYGAINLITDRFRSATNKGGIQFLAAEYQTTPGAALTIQAVPEPTTLAALAFGGAGVAAALRRRKQVAKAA